MMMLSKVTSHRHRRLLCVVTWCIGAVARREGRGEALHATGSQAQFVEAGRDALSRHVQPAGDFLAGEAKGVEAGDFGTLGLSRGEVAAAAEIAQIALDGCEFHLERRGDGGGREALAEQGKNAVSLQDEVRGERLVVLEEQGTLAAECARICRSC